MKIDYLSSSRLNTYLSCPLKYYYQYDKAIKIQTKSDAAEFGKFLHKILYNFFSQNDLSYRKLQSLFQKEKEVSFSYSLYESGLDILKKWHKRQKFTEKILKLEYKFNLNIKNYKHSLFGFIDKIQEIDSDTIEIVDYKTDKYVWDDEKKFIQLNFYNIVVRKIFPNYKKYLLSLDYLRHGKYSYFLNESQAKLFFNWMVKMISKIENDNSQKGIIGDGCIFCDYKNMCKEIKNLLDKDIIFHIDKLKTDEEISNCYQRIKNYKKILENTEKSIASILKNRLQDKEKIQAGMYEYKLINKRVIKYDLDDIFSFLSKEDIKKIVDVNNTKLKENIKNLNSKDIERIKNGSLERVGSSYLYCKPIKIKNDNDIEKVFKNVFSIINGTIK